MRSGTGRLVDTHRVEGELPWLQISCHDSPVGNNHRVCVQCERWLAPVKSIGRVLTYVCFLPLLICGAWDFLQMLYPEYHIATDCRQRQTGEPSFLPFSQVFNLQQCKSAALSSLLRSCMGKYIFFFHKSTCYLCLHARDLLFLSNENSLNSSFSF